MKSFGMSIMMYRKLNGQIKIKKNEKHDFQLTWFSPDERNVYLRGIIIDKGE